MSLLSLVELLGTLPSVYLAHNQHTLLYNPILCFNITSLNISLQLQFFGWICLSSMLCFPFHSIPSHNKLSLLHAINYLRFCSPVITINYFEVDICMTCMHCSWPLSSTIPYHLLQFLLLQLWHHLFSV